MPPASTTPAFFKTGFMSVVWARVSYPSRSASSSRVSRSVSPWAAVSTARLAARRETVSTVPSAGFITAL